MTEQERILAEVDKRRERAKQLGLLQLLALFRNHLQYLTDGPNLERLPSSVTDVKVADITLDATLIQSREICFGKRSYLFVFKPKYDTDPRGDPYITGHLLLNREGRTLFDLFCVGDDEDWMGTVWRPLKVDAFIEGDWVQEISAFMREVLALADQRQRQSQIEHTNKELEDLKRKFGLS